MKTTFIYVLKDPETLEVRYVGKSDRPTVRLLKHRFSARHEKNHRARWLSSLMNRGQRPLLEVVSEVPHSEWPSWEAAYIQFFLEQGFDLTNGTAGGDTGPDNTGKKMSEEARKNLRAAKLGDKNPNFGKTFSPEHRARLGAPRRGRKDSELVRANKKSAMKLWWAKRKAA